MYIGYLVKKEVSKNENNNTKKASAYIFPIVLLFLSTAIEKFFTEKYTYVTIETKITLAQSPDMVFDYVQSFDTLISSKPFVFKLGIQTPLKCVLEHEGIGAKRTCYFKEGTIDEIVTDYKRGELLKMKITKYNMPGRKWLHFIDAIYLLKQVGDSTELTRITTYKTELKPRIYWGFWEEKAIRAEHEYVLTDLKRRLNEKGQIQIEK